MRNNITRLTPQAGSMQIQTPTINASDVKINTSNIPNFRTNSGMTEGLSGIGNITGLTSGALQMVQGATELSQIHDTSKEQQDAITTKSSGNFNGIGTYDDLQNLWENAQLAKTDYSADDVDLSTSEQLAGFGTSISGGSQIGSSIGNFFGLKGSLIGGAIGAGVGTIAGGIGRGIGRAKAYRESGRLNALGEQANAQFKRNFENSLENTAKNNMNNTLLNIAALGGELRHEDTFNNGLKFITEGGTHEENPLGGVPQGIAADGIPNLVEEGEVIYNDYVFSKRLKLPKQDIEILGLKKGKEYSYADAATHIQKESEERPNDIISKKNLDTMMGRLQQSQETFKQKQQESKIKRQLSKLSPEEQLQLLAQIQGSQYAKGGHLFADGDTITLKAPNIQLPFYNSSVQSPIYNLSELDWSYPGYKSPKYVLTDSKGKSYGFKARGITPKNATKATTKNSTTNGNIAAQLLRAVPVIGSGISALASAFDKPNYENIERAERAYNNIPYVTSKPLTQRLEYNPIDMNYIANNINNQAVGNRRLAIEGALGNSVAASALLASMNYGNQTALGNAYMTAMQENEKRKQQVAEFNRQTNSANIENQLQVDLQNRNRDQIIADAMLKAGMLRDEELAKTQTVKSSNYSNFLNNIGNLGEEIVNRQQAAANAETGTWGTLSDIMQYLAASQKGIAKKGGKLFTIKKGGKHA